MITICKRMRRDKLRRILAWELYKDEIDKARQNIYNHPLQINVTEDFLRETAYKQYLNDYYPGKYVPFEDE